MIVAVWLAALTVLVLGALAVAITAAFRTAAMRDQVDHLTEAEGPGTGRHAG